MPRTSWGGAIRCPEWVGHHNLECLLLQNTAGKHLYHRCFTWKNPHFSTTETAEKKTHCEVEMLFELLTVLPFTMLWEVPSMQMPVFWQSSLDRDFRGEWEGPGFVWSSCKIFRTKNHPPIHYSSNAVDQVVEKKKADIRIPSKKSLTLAILLSTWAFRREQSCQPEMIFLCEKAPVMLEVHSQSFDLWGAASSGLSRKNLHPISTTPFKFPPILWTLSICSNCFFSGEHGPFRSISKSCCLYSSGFGGLLPLKPAEVSAAKSRAARFLRHFLPAWPRHSQRSRCHNQSWGLRSERYGDPQCKAGFKSLVDGFKCRFMCVYIYIQYIPGPSTQMIHILEDLTHP